jgi:hypothetical protein
VKDWYAPSDAYWMRKRDLDFNASSPIFEYKGREYLVSSSKECRLWQGNGQIWYRNVYVKALDRPLEFPK